MSHYAYVNGKFVRHKDAKVSIDDRGFLFADGVYEVIGCIHGNLADEVGHMDRLERSLSELKMKMPMSREEFAAAMRKLLKKNKLKDALIYMQVTRGVARRDFKFPDPAVPQTVIMTAWPFDFEKGASRMFKVATMPDIRWKRRDIKTVALLPQALAKQVAVEMGCDEAWMVDDAGFITEGASTNAWIVRGDVIQTRPATHEILRGVTRTAIFKVAQDLKMKVVEKAFTPEEAYKADEAFVSSATTFVVPVVEIDGNRIGSGKSGPVAKALYDEYRAYVVGQRGAQLKWRA
jgi:D-alanine transaminase